MATQKNSFQETPQYGGKPIDYLLEPIVLKKTDAQFIEAKLTAVLKEIEDFTNIALRDKTILAELGLPVNLDPSPTPLGLHIPFARFDFLFDSATKELNILELNTDGTSGYNIVQWLGEQAQITEEENPNFRLSERLLSALQEHSPKAPEIWLTDFTGLETSWEQKNLMERWRGLASGASPRFADPSLRSWKPGALIYRRVLGWQLRSQPERAQALLSDWKDHKITVVGGWSSDVGMSKVWPAFLKSSVCPRTELMAPHLGDEILANREAWVIKGALSYSGKAVIRGKDLTEPRWNSAVQQALAETKAGRPWIAQSLVQVPPYESKPLELGLYFLNGKASGYLARWGHKETISETSRELLRPVKIIS